MSNPLAGGFRGSTSAVVTLITAAAVLAVVLTTLMLPVAEPARMMSPNLPREMVAAVLLMAGCVVTIEWGRFLEGSVLVGQRPLTGLSAWAMATVTLLPAFWVLPVMIVAFAYARWRAVRVAPWKWVGSCAFVVLAGLLAGQVLHLGNAGVPVTMSSGLAGVVVVAAAVIAFLVVESTLVFGCAHFSGAADEFWAHKIFADKGVFLTEAAVLALGAVTGLVAAAAPWFVLMLLPAFGLMQQAVLHQPLRDQADVDSKTGLLQYEPWRRVATEMVAQQATTRRPWAVLFADLDHFKIFNDNQGHLTGDRALTAVAQVLRDTLREHDLVARFGGEEFCVLLPGATGEQATRIADRIRRKIKALGTQELGEPLTISIGVAGVDAGQAGTTLLEALSLADRALYQAKLDGRDAVRLAGIPTAG